MHCLPHCDAAASRAASSAGGRVGHGFCSDRNLIVKIKACAFLKYQLGVVDCLGSFSPTRTPSGCLLGDVCSVRQERKGRILREGSRGDPRDT